MDSSSEVSSLLNCFRQAPPSVIPAMLDCILASSNSSPSSLFSSLLSEFPNFMKEFTEGGECTDSGRGYGVGSYMSALCYLLKKSGAKIDDMEVFIWSVLIPILKWAHASHLQVFNEVVSMFIDVMVETNCWNAVEETLFPFIFRLVGLSMGLNQSEESAIYQWRSCLNLELSDNRPSSLKFLRCSSDKLTDAVRRDPSLFQSGFFPLSVSCYILASVLNALVKCKNTADNVPGMVKDCQVDIWTGNLLWDLCNMTFQMLLQSGEHRSRAVRVILPSIFEAFASHGDFEVLVHGEKHALSRELLVVDLWASCKKLFSLGLSERRDAYTVLSLCLASFSFGSGSKDGNVDGKRTTSDIRIYEEFWDELKRGLVDKEKLMRKQSLHILKMVLNISQEPRAYHDFAEVASNEKGLAPRILTKKERWADKEAKSLGVGRVYKFTDHGSQQTWEAYILLYEMLEEYGTHLVEAAWSHQMNLLIHSFPAPGSSVNSGSRELPQTPMRTFSEMCGWLAVLWERGFFHDNPQVRCLIMQSFLGIVWDDYGNCTSLVPDEFILGPLMQGLNDPVHHKEFGVKGVYSSWTIDAATKIFLQYGSYLDERERTKFVCQLARLSLQYSFGRPGLMCLAECIASAARGVPRLKSSPIERLSDVICDMPPVTPSPENSTQNEKTCLLDSLRLIIEGTKQHFNANYRFQVCEKILDAASSVVNAGDVPLVNILHFISNLPRDVTNIGPLRFKVQKWLLNDEKCSSGCKSQILGFLTSLTAFPENFVYLHQPLGANVTYDDDDVDVDLWQTEADRWARVTFLLIENQHVQSIYVFVQDHGSTLIKENNQLRWVPVKFLILVLSLVQELQVYQRRISDDPFPKSRKTDHDFPSTENHIQFVEQSSFLKFAQSLLSIADNLVSFAKISSCIWWSTTVEGENILPNAVKGRLGGPSQRRLSSFATTQVLEAIIAVKCLAAVLGWCGKVKLDSSLDCVTTFLWDFCWKMVTSPLGRSEAKAELSLAGHEAMTHVLRVLVPVFSPLSLHLISEGRNPLLSAVNDEQVLDSFVQTFLQNVNDLIAAGDLVRTRRAILMNWKWNCLESLLSIPKSALKNGVRIQNSYYLSQNTMKLIFDDLVESLENAGEASVLPILRSVRLVMELFASGRLGVVVSSCDGITAQMMWDLVNSCWILHVSCTKRRVAPIAALLSSVLHSSVFNDVNMHQSDGMSGPLKWFIGKILDVGSKSPRTTRLAALHLTGLWLKYPTTIKFYMNELKLLTMYGSVAFDEDFEAELTENQEAKSEVAVLAQSPDPELTAEFVNTELYARVSVATLFYKLSDIADKVGSVDENEISRAALLSGQMFLLELLQFALNDKDLSKELYKKYSAIHRRKIRVWQMICILVRFTNQEIVETVTCFLHKALQKNNMPSVRQYLETFAIHIYLKFPLLVGQELVPLLRNYDLRPQTLSSYVYIAANVILHADESIKSSHLAELFPPIIPMLTSHHHTLRGFAQLLVYQILQKLLPGWDTDASVTLSLPKRCLEDLKSYLTCNPDCARLRASMEGYLDSFDPKAAVTPAGIFSNRVEELDFECVPKNLMEQVITFLNDARDDLRGSMAKDAAAIRNEGLNGNDYSNQAEMPVDSDGGASLIHQQNGVTSDFQKKFTLSKYEMQSAGDLLMDGKESLESFVGIEKEDQLLEQLLSSRSTEMQKLREGRQPFVLVASFIDRIPNLAGLARTCEVFRAAGLAIADKSISKDKQFQLISVTAEKWIPLIEVPVSSVKTFLERKKHEGFAILGLEQTANSTPLDQYVFPRKTVLVLGKEKEGIPVEIIHVLDACIEIPQLGIIRSLNVHVSGAIAMWEYTRQQRLR